MKQIVRLVILAAVCSAAAPLSAQEQQRPRQSGQLPLRVQVVVSRYQGEKKISSLPYSLSVVANDNDKTTLRMGVDVPIPTTVFATTTAGGATNMPQTSYTYRSIGTNIECLARTLEEGVFKLDLGVDDSSVSLPPREAAASVPGVSAPSVRKFSSTFNIVLRDGQTVQHTSATDPASGEVLRIDVTLTVLK